ncbi:MAG TPA: ferritin-like domain-containing protein [Gemmatimonadales bacterium]|nr:ferritin-like domain-containing protein [Gemmatimonadales bacterium]
MHSAQAREREALAFLGQLANSPSRRTFLEWAGITLAVAATACSDNESPLTPHTNPSTHTTTEGGTSVSLGSGDTGVLNYAYALEQLEAAFYIQVVKSPYHGISAAETQLLTDVRDHEVIHRNFLKSALGSDAIADVAVTFESVNFADRTSVLTTARTFEDLGVSAYNGAGRLLTDPDHLLVAGKIVSVEARHAAAIRDLLNPKTASFAGNDVVDARGLDQARKPSKVLTIAKPFVTTTIDAAQLP